MRILNLGILAHVDAGKTSLTERILFETGVIAAVGRVDKGTTQTDTLALERERGITIQSAVVSFRIGELKVNLIDTPGHSDFIAEVERALHVLDGVVVVISAVEGIQAQTRGMVRAVRLLGIPLILVINKIDRVGARDEALLTDIVEKLELPVVAMNHVVGLGSRDVAVVPYSLTDQAFVDTMANQLARNSDRLIEAYVATQGHLPVATVKSELTGQVRNGHLVPVYFTSALLGVGVDQLIDGIAALLPPAPAPTDTSPRARVFKIQRDAAGEKVALVRLVDGELTVRQRVRFRQRVVDGQVRDYEAKITGIDAFDAGSTAPAGHARAGDIVRIHGIKEARIGDEIGGEPRGAGDQRFALPTLESVVRADDPALAPRLYLALQQMAEQDPFINVRRLGQSGVLAVHLYGEVQKEVIAATLADEFALDVTFAPSQIICIERPIGTGAAVDSMGDPSNPFVATIGLRIEPGRHLSGITYHRELGSLPRAFYSAIEETVHGTLEEGLCGWQVRDCVVTLTDTGFSSPVSVAADFRKLTPLVLMDALRQAGTMVLEPIQRFTLDVPAATIGDVLSALVAARAIPQETTTRGQTSHVTGTIPAGEVRHFEQQLPGLSRGEGLFTAEFDHYGETAGPPPTRPRTDFNPLNRPEYLARVSQG
ncbi:MAG: TetM/TetW/TetO/TetS family tetracycline resistance ribosomal protection protein [Chloroflexia bacterium]|nr:TetM/TetW/TetO/TetS family tetracycline resistance ribosomal protection protein [Chloroflexia bacterium]